jgi:hypothetical protein
MEREELNELELLLDQDVSNLTDLGIETLEKLKTVKEKKEREE